MVEPVSITIAFVAAKLLGSALDQLGKDVGGAPSRLIEWVRRRLAGGNELERLEDAPDSVRRVNDLGAALEASLSGDLGAQAELEALVAQLKAERPEVYQSVVGDQNVVANHSTVTVNYGQHRPIVAEVRWAVQHRTGSQYELTNIGSATAREVALRGGGSVVRLDVTSGGPDVSPDESIVFVAVTAWGSAEGPDGVTIEWTDGVSAGRRSTLRSLPPKR